METSNKLDKLKILLVSDVHEAWDRLDQLLEWFKNENEGKLFDYVFLNGDMANVIHPSSGVDDPAEEEAGRKVVKDLLEKLIPLSHNGVKYIPGNHDSASFLDASTDKIQSDKAQNLHMGIYELTDDLLLSGLGGSAPCYLRTGMPLDT